MEYSTRKKSALATVMLIGLEICPIESQHRATYLSSVEDLSLGEAENRRVRDIYILQKQNIHVYPFRELLKNVFGSDASLWNLDVFLQAHATLIVKHQ